MTHLLVSVAASLLEHDLHSCGADLVGVHESRSETGKRAICGRCYSGRVFFVDAGECAEIVCMLDAHGRVGSVSSHVTGSCKIDVEDQVAHS